MSFKKLFKPTKIKLLCAMGLFLIIGFLRIFTLQNVLTGELYKVSLFDQYKFYHQHINDSWYRKDDKFFWPYILFLHLMIVYVSVCTTAFIVNRLRGKD